MKRYTSSFLKSIAVILMGFPLIYILILATSFNIPLSGCMRILLAPFYHFVAGFAVLVGYGLWEMRRWSWYGFIVFQGLLFYEDAIIASESAESHHKVFIFAASVVLQFVIGLRLAREIRVPYFFPRIRWWESNPKYRLSIPVSLQKESGEDLIGDILDLSHSGCFLKLRAHLEMSQKLKLSFKVYGQNLNLVGIVVWEANSTVTHPQGVGVIFEYPPKDQRKALRVILGRLRRIALHYRKNRYWMDPDQFERILLELESTTPQQLNFVSLVRPPALGGVAQKRVGKDSG